MIGELTRLNSPIDVMYLAHKALSAEGGRVQKLIAEAKLGDSLDDFRTAYGFWSKVLTHHAVAEDKYMTAPLKECPPARTNEQDHAELADLMNRLSSHMDKRYAKEIGTNVSEAIDAIDERQHQELMEKLDDVQSALNEENRKFRSIARSARNLYQKVVVLWISQDNHLEFEEDFVLPEVRQRMSEAQQLEVARHLLVDDQAEDPRWIRDWMTRDLTPGERTILNRLEERFESAPTVAD